MQNVLILCTGNSARSIMAEVILNDIGDGRFQAFSAGSQPTGKVNPGAVRQLRSRGHETSDLASKSWDQFSGPGAPAIDIVITVCDNAAGESCPVWNGAPVTARWGIPDPAAASGSDAEVDVAFSVAYEQLAKRFRQLIELDDNQLDAATLQPALQAIGDRAKTDD